MDDKSDDTLGGKYNFRKDDFEWLQLPLKTRHSSRYQVMLWHWWVIDDKIRWVCTDGMRAHVWEYDIRGHEPERLGTEGSAVPMTSRVYAGSVEFMAFEVVDAQAPLYVKFRQTIKDLITEKFEKYEEFELRGLDNAREVKGAYRGLTPFIFCVDREVGKINYVGESVASKLLPDDKEFLGIDGHFITQAMRGLKFGTKIMRYNESKQTVFVKTHQSQERWAAIQPIHLDGYLGKWRTTS